MCFKRCNFSGQAICKKFLFGDKKSFREDLDKTLWKIIALKATVLLRVQSSENDKALILIEIPSIVFIVFVEEKEKFEQLKSFVQYTESTRYF